MIINSVTHLQRKLKTYNLVELHLLEVLVVWEG